MAFLIVTCIEPASSFLGCIKIKYSMIIMSLIIAAIAVYTYFEARTYFKDNKTFGFLTKEIYLGIQGTITILVLIILFVQKKLYSLIIYLVTLALAGFGLAVNIFKISVFKVDEGISDDGEKNFIKWFYFIRIGVEFISEMIVSYMVYSMKENE